MSAMFGTFAGFDSGRQARLETPNVVTVQVTEHAGRGHRPPIVHFDPPSASHVLRLLLVEIRRRAEDLHLSREPDGRLALRAGAAEAHAPLAYVQGLSTADAILSLAELGRL